MYEEQLLIDRIKSKTSYTSVYLADDTINDFTGMTVLDSDPKIYVGHVGIKLHFPESVWRNSYDELENNSMLITTIQVLCTRSSFVSVRTNIANAYKGWSPFGAIESNYSQVVFLENRIVSRTRNNVWFEEHIGLVFPQIT